MALALDTSGVATSAAASIPVSITTTLGSGQIIVCIGTQDASITSVTASGLTFSARKPYFANGGSFPGLAIYVANYTSNFSGNITVALPTGSFTTVEIFAIGGADTASGISSPPFDSNGSLTASAASGVAAGTTSNAKDFVFTTGTTSGATSTAGSGWTAIPGSGVQFLITMYQIVSATGTYTPSTATGTISGNLTDAVMESVVTNLMPQIWM